MIGELDKRTDVPVVSTSAAAEGSTTWSAIKNDTDVRSAAADTLHREVAAMNTENFVVRPKRRYVEEYAKRDAWNVVTPASLSELAAEVAGLPSEIDPEGEEAKRFDLLVLNLQLAVLRIEPAFARLRDQVRAIAGLLEEKSAIPMIAQHMPLIQDVQTDEWWQDVTLPILEVMRRRLRDLVKLIEKRQRKVLYTDFEDQIGHGAEVTLPGLGPAGDAAQSPDFAKFRMKAQAYLRAHVDHITVQKLRRNVPLTALDLAELERMLAASGVGPKEQIAQAKAESKGLGLFVRSLIGLDREAAKGALSGFLAGKALGSNQIDFINLVVNHLTEHGVMEAARLYESPFTDLAPSGPEALFSSSQVDELIAGLATVRANAEAA